MDIGFYARDQNASRVCSEPVTNSSNRTYRLESIQIAVDTVLSHSYRNVMFVKTTLF